MVEAGLVLLGVAVLALFGFTLLTLWLVPKVLGPDDHEDAAADSSATEA